MPKHAAKKTTKSTKRPAKKAPAQSTKRAKPAPAGGGEIHRYRIALREIQPEIWRRIAVPAESTFWDLHVAIQDAMGWRDCHLHAFFLGDPTGRGGTRIGIPDEHGFAGGPEFLPGWEIPLADHFVRPGDRARYDYDFGDRWEHDLVLEEIAPRPARGRFPVCLAGARACPPEDCGGVGGYEDLLAAIADPTHREHESLSEWLEESYEDYDPEAFDPKRVRFSDPDDRWRAAFGHRY